MFGLSFQQLIIQLHVFSTLLMTGVVWHMQVVHYPMFLDFKKEDGVRATEFHRQRTGYLVMPVMVVEFVTAVLLTSSSWMMLYGNFLWLNLMLLVLIWAITFLRHVPRHKRLSESFEPDTVHALVRANWVRTLLWTLRSILLIRFLG